MAARTSSSSSSRRFSWARSSAIPSSKLNAMLSPSCGILRDEGVFRHASALEWATSRPSGPYGPTVGIFSTSRISEDLTINPTILSKSPMPGRIESSLPIKIIIFNCRSLFS
jgi:hypothetical protein